jgi:hypothetical protein
MELTSKAVLGWVCSSDVRYERITKFWRKKILKATTSRSKKRRMWSCIQKEKYKTVQLLVGKFKFRML